MQRRQFLISGLFAMGASATIIPTRLAAQQTEGISPFGIAVSDGPRGRLVSRVYPGRRQRDILMMMRDADGDTWMSLTVPRGGIRLLRRVLSEGGLPMRVAGSEGDEVEFGVRLEHRGAGQLGVRFEGPEGTSEGAANGDPNPTDGGGGGGATQAFGFWGALVAIVAMVVGLGAYAIASGTPVRLKMRCNGAGCDLDFAIGEEALGHEEDGFIADPSCEGLPPLPC